MADRIDAADDDEAMANCGQPCLRTGPCRPRFFTRWLGTLAFVDPDLFYLRFRAVFEANQVISCSAICLDELVDLGLEGGTISILGCLQYREQEQGYDTDRDICARYEKFVT
jgi:hypothetical protein